MRDSGAIISDDGAYRYHLWRVWQIPEVGFRPLNWLMLNPSTADGDVDDPTIRRCIGFAKRDGFHAINVCNLFAYRATDPKALRAVDAIGPENGLWLDRMIDVSLSRGVPIAAAWGAHLGAGSRANDVIAHIRERGAHLVSLGETKSGSPRHPLYVRADQPLAPYPQGNDE